MVLPYGIIGDGNLNELSFTIARATPCEVRFGLFLAQIALSLQNKKRALHGLMICVVITQRPLFCSVTSAHAI